MLDLFKEITQKALQCSKLKVTFDDYSKFDAHKKDCKKKLKQHIKANKKRLENIRRVNKSKS